MRTYEDYINVIFRHEGFYSNNKNDSGGPTKYGVSLKFLKSIGLDINSDNIIDIEDIKSITPEIAKNIYYEFFWIKMNLSSINNELLKLHLFDMGVNAGTKTAIKLLQRMIGAYPDGIIGPKTLKLINEYPNNIVENYKIARKGYYMAIINKNPKLSIFKRGWFNRVDTTKF